MVCGGSSRLDHDRFRTKLLLTIHFSSPVIIRLKKGSNSLRLRCKLQALMRFVKWISFNSSGIQILNFVTSQRRCIWGSIVDFGIFNISSISRTVTWQLWLLFGYHQIHLADLNVAHFWMRNLQNEIYQTNFDTVWSLRLPHHTHHATL